MTKITAPILISLVFMISAGCASNDDTATEKAPEASADRAIPDQSSLPPEKRLRVGPTSAPAAPPGPEIAALAFGKGIAKGSGLDVNFMHDITLFKNGDAKGEFAFSAIGEAGVIDIKATVACSELNSKTRKGWVGGKVQSNDSTNPLYVSAVGDDVWFRILDLGATEMTAFVSLPVFKQKGIDSAATYCDKKPWSDEGLLELDQGALAIFP